MDEGCSWCGKCAHPGTRTYSAPIIPATAAIRCGSDAGEVSSSPPTTRRGNLCPASKVKRGASEASFASASA